VWLGGLPEGIGFEELRAHMGQAGGTCKRAQLTSGNTGFALFATDEEAQQAILMLNGSLLGGQGIVVDTWTKKEGGEKKSWGGGKGGWSKGWGGGKGVLKQQFTKPVVVSGKQGWGKGAQKGGWSKGGGWGNNGGWGKSVKFEVRKPEATVWVGNLPEGVTFQELKDHMSQAGEVKHAQLTNGNTGFVWFKDEASAQAAIMSLNGSDINGSSILVDPWTKKEKN